MRVGIVTVHDSSNLGSYLQALGMQEVIKSHGDIPYIVETRSHFTTLCLYLGYNNAPPVRSIKSFLRFAIKSLRHPKPVLRAYKKYKAYKRDWDRFEKVIKFKKYNKNNLDAILLGSDEIWNMNQPAFVNPLMYGIGFDVEKKSAYAISVGNVPVEQFCKYTKLLNGIKNLDGILVRDEYTREVLGQCGIQANERICDPTLQVDIRKYMKPKSEFLLPEDKYMIVYSYGINEKFQSVIKQFAKEKGLKTVAVSLHQHWCDEYFNCSPLEFGAVLENAEYVFTTTFHGTIFSSLYHKKFVSLPASQKVGDVLNLLGLKECEISQDIGYDEFCEKINLDHDYDAMESGIEKLRAESSALYMKYVHGEDNDKNM